MVPMIQTPRAETNALCNWKMRQRGALQIPLCHECCDLLVFEMVPLTNDERILLVFQQLVTEPEVNCVFCTTSSTPLHNAVGDSMKVEELQQW